MDALLQQIGTWLINQGPLGIAVLALGYMLWRKEGEIKDVRSACDTKLDAAQKRIDDLQDKRLNEALSLQTLVAAFNDNEKTLLAALTKGARE